MCYILFRKSELFHKVPNNLLKNCLGIKLKSLLSIKIQLSTVSTPLVYEIYIHIHTDTNPRRILGEIFGKIRHYIL